jgi:1,2-diacylglycerol 3-alpha-glucosyltransferase
MRVLMISDVYFPRVNGVSTSIQTFRRGLHQAGHETVLIAPEYPLATEGEHDEIIRIPSRYLPRDPEDRMMKRAAIRALLPILQQRDFDLVHIQTPFVAHYVGVELARKLGVPVVESYHTYFEEYLHHYVPLLPRALMRFIARRFTTSQCNVLDALVVPSRAMQTALHDYGVRCPMHIIPTGMEMERFAGGDGSRFRAELGIGLDQPTLVHVGRVAHEKNIDFLFRTLALVARRQPNVVLILAGEGPALNHCKQQVVALGLRNHVKFVGYLSRGSALLDCYRAGDLFVFASKTETQGLVLLESMALGVPVVSTAHMGTTDIVRPERGARMAPDDEAGFANIVVDLLSSPERRKAMSQEAMAFAESWSASAMTQKLAGLYANMIERAKRPQSTLLPITNEN